HLLQPSPMSRLACLVALAAIASSAAAQQSPRTITLAEAVQTAERQGLAAQAARSTRDAARHRDRAFNARLLPQLGVSGNAADLNRGINPIPLPNGETQFVRQAENRSSLGLVLSQAIPWTGSEVTIGSRAQRVDIFRDEGTSQLWQTTPFVVGLRQQLFRPRTLLWDQRENELTATLADRRYLETREELAGQTASAYFDLFAAQLALANADANAAVNDTLYTLNKGRYEVGKIGENDLLQSELALLRARASLDGARLEQQRTEAALRRLLGLPASQPLVAAAPTAAPITQVDPERAVGFALRGASTVREVELDAMRAQRRVSAARSANGFGATLAAEVGFNQTATAFGDAYQSPLGRQSLQLGVSMPLLQWGGGRADVQAARADVGRATATGRARREALEEEARFAALQLVQTGRMLAISAKADTVAAKRFEVAKNRYVIGRIGIGELYIAQSEKDAALQAYVQALRGYWAAHYRLRRLTLYDFEAGKEIVE
ncbi:MAG TPA: TolC family protein, partial [Gemmatimonadaceae bacterium]|nr:TolC family protein [Gemmatimonadaceae bacterium]